MRADTSFLDTKFLKPCKTYRFIKVSFLVFVVNKNNYTIKGVILSNVVLKKREKIQSLFKGKVPGSFLALHGIPTKRDVKNIRKINARISSGCFLLIYL